MSQQQMEFEPGIGYENPLAIKKSTVCNHSVSATDAEKEQDGRSFGPFPYAILVCRNNHTLAHAHF